MKHVRLLIAGALVVLALVGCDTVSPGAPTAPAATTTIETGSSPDANATAYPAPGDVAPSGESYPAPGLESTTAYPAP